MNPPLDPDLQPTTTSPVELRYFNVLRGILDQVKQTGRCQTNAAYVGTCYQPNVPLTLASDSRILPTNTSLTAALNLWVMANNMTLYTGVHLPGQPPSTNYLILAN